MGFGTGAYATVWKIKQGNGNYTDVQLSTSYKNKQTNEYETDFSRWCRFIGEAHTKAATLKERERIKLGDCNVSNRFDKEKNQEFFTFKVFSFESMTETGGNKPAPSKSVSKKTAFDETGESIEEEFDEENCPF